MSEILVFFISCVFFAFCCSFRTIWSAVLTKISHLKRLFSFKIGGNAIFSLIFFGGNEEIATFGPKNQTRLNLTFAQPANSPDVKKEQNNNLNYSLITLSYDAEK
ncbi:MAG: hypothetical protein J6I36_02755 [Bacteroidaceae bacterium]|nr:hypothetical protein [Bacteroidaceae bacterium]